MMAKPNFVFFVCVMSCNIISRCRDRFLKWCSHLCRRIQDTWEPFSASYSQVMTPMMMFSLPLARKPIQMPNPIVQPGVCVTPVLLPPSQRRSCAAGGPRAPASPRLLCLGSWCCGAPCWKQCSCTRIPCLLQWKSFRLPPCVTVPTESTSAGGLGSHPMTPILPFLAAACGESGGSTRAQMDSTVVSDL